MRVAGKFTFVRHRCLRAICLPKSADLNVYGISPRFSVCFQKISVPISLMFLAQIRLAGELTFFLRRCLLAIFLSKSMDLSVYGLSPGFPDCFSIISSPNLYFLAQMRFAGEITFVLRRKAPPCTVTLSSNVGVTCFNPRHRQFLLWGAFPKARIFLWKSESVSPPKAGVR